MRDGPYRDIQTEGIWVQMAMTILSLLFCPITEWHAFTVFEMILCGLSLYRERIPNDQVTLTSFFLSRERRTFEM